MALPYHLFVISTQVPGMPIKIQFGTALVLLVFVLTMNLLARSFAVITAASASGRGDLPWHCPPGQV